LQGIQRRVNARRFRLDHPRPAAHFVQSSYEQLGVRREIVDDFDAAAMDSHQAEQGVGLHLF
jgi:hypothetical protein